MDARAVAHLGALIARRVAQFARNTVEAVQDHRNRKPVYQPRHAYVRKPVEQRAKLIEPGHVTGHFAADLGQYVAQLTRNVDVLGRLADTVRGDIHWFDIECPDLASAPDDPSRDPDRAPAVDHAVI